MAYRTNEKMLFPENIALRVFIPKLLEEKDDTTHFFIIENKLTSLTVSFEPKFFNMIVEVLNCDEYRREIVAVELTIEKIIKKFFPNIKEVKGLIEHEK